MTAKNLAALLFALLMIGGCCVAVTGAAGAAFAFVARIVQSVLP